MEWIIFLTTTACLTGGIVAQQVVDLAQSVTVGVTEEEGFHSSLELWTIFNCSFAPCQAPLHYHVFYRLP